MSTDASSLPSGIIVMWSGASTVIPTGWVLCNGQNNTPDLRDRFIVGAGNSYSVGAKGGEATHTLTIDEMPRHTHSSKLPKWKDGGISPVTYSAAGSSYPQIVDYTGGDKPHNNMPPYYALCFIMKQ